jgi:predicted permease
MRDDLRLAGRLLLRHPGFAALAILTLALGIGATTAVFSVLDGVLLRPAPLPHIDRLVMVWETDTTTGTTREPASVPDYLDFVERSRSFERLAAIASGQVTLVSPEGDAQRLPALEVGEAFLPLLGVEPLTGRGFAADDVRPGAPRVVLIGERLWERRFGRDPAVVGKALPLDGEAPSTIVGVLPEAASFGVAQVFSAAAYARGLAGADEGSRIDVFSPLAPDPRTNPRETHSILVLGRLAPGVTLAAARTEMTGVASDLVRAYPVNAGRGVHLEPLAEVVFGPVRPALLLVMTGVGLVLLVACANVAHLLLARGAARTREIAVRGALGAGGGRLARQFFIENLVMVALGAGAGTLLAGFGTEALKALAPADVPRLGDVAVNGRVLLGTTAVTVIIAFVFGLVPTLQARGLDLVRALKGGAGSPSSGRDARRARSVLVVTELALGVVLLAGAGLLAKSFLLLRSVDPGFRTAGVAKAQFQLPPSRYPAAWALWPDFKEAHAFTRALVERLEAVPGVEAAAVAGDHPLDRGFTSGFAVVGREAEARSWPEITVRRVTPGYFTTVALRLERGRLLSSADGTRDRPVCLVNEATAKRFFAGREALGERIRLWGAERAVVGIVADEKMQGLDRPAPIALYLPLAQAPSLDGSGVILARTTLPPAEAFAALRAAVRGLDPGLPLDEMETLDTTVARSVAQRRFVTLLLAAFAATGLGLAALGVYGLLSYTVARRTRELGIRMALGATPAAVRRLVMGNGLKLAALGLVFGLCGAWGATRLLRGLLYGVGPADPATYIAVALFLASVAAGASALPARRATRIDPARALRGE